MYGFYYHFNNLRFDKHKTSTTLSAAHVVVYAVSSGILKRRLLKGLLDHPVNGTLRARGLRAGRPKPAALGGEGNAQLGGQ